MTICSHDYPEYYQVSANCSGKSKIYKRCFKCKKFLVGYELTALSQDSLREIYIIAKKEIDKLPSISEGNISADGACGM